MIYREYLVMRKAIAWSVGIVVAIQLVALLFPPKNVEKVDYDSIIMNAGIFAALFAWVFGVALGNGSRQPARVLWVLPAERWKLALQLIAVDFAAMIAAIACIFGVGLLASLIPISKTELVGTVSAANIALVLTGVFATYGWGALVGMLGRRMPYAGLLATPALALWLTVAEQNFRISPLFRAPILANPFAVFNTTLAITGWQQHHNALDVVTVSLQWLGTAWEWPVLAAISIATCGLAVILWQRAQVIF